MSNLKKYLKVYKEDAQRANAFKQYMQIVSENQDFFTTHEVNEFFTDMIKDGTLVYDEGVIGDMAKKIALPLTITAALLFAPLSSTKANDAMLKGDVITAKTDSQILNEIDKQLEEYDTEYTQKDSKYKKDMEKATQKEVNRLSVERYKNELEYYNNIMKYLKGKQIYKLKVPQETKDYYSKEPGQLKIKLKELNIKSNIDEIIDYFNDIFQVKDIQMN